MVPVYAKTGSMTPCLIIQFVRLVITLANLVRVTQLFVQPAIPQLIVSLHQTINVYANQVSHKQLKENSSANRMLK